MDVAAGGAAEEEMAQVSVAPCGNWYKRSYEANRHRKTCKKCADAGGEVSDGTRPRRMVKKREEQHARNQAKHQSDQSEDFIEDVRNSLEEKYPIKKDFLRERKISPRMRAVLVDWLVDVQLQYHLLQETLYLAVQILDRYLQAVPTVGKRYLQLVGVAAMYVACKYEEVYMPDIGDFVFITDKAYDKQQLLSMEVQIVKTLEFQFSRPISLTFLRRFSKVVEANPIHHCFSKFFLELAMMEYSLCHVRPSLIAAAALYISLCICELNKKTGPQNWDAKMVHYSTYKLPEVEECAKALAAVIVQSSTWKYEAVKKKYSNSKMMKVALRQELTSDCVIRLSEGKSPFP